jgi:hypothetical protein
VLWTLAVLALDANGGLGVKPAGGLPRQHRLGDSLAQEVVTVGATQDAALDRDPQKFLKCF